MPRVTIADLDAAINTLSQHVLGDLCARSDVAAIERVRDWLESEQLSRTIKAVAKETGHSVPDIRSALTKSSKNES